MKPLRIALAALAVGGVALWGTSATTAAPVAAIGAPGKALTATSGSVELVQYRDRDRDRRWRPAPRRYYYPPPRVYYPPPRYYYPPAYYPYYPPRYYQPCVGIYGVPVGAQFCF